MKGVHKIWKGCIRKRNGAQESGRGAQESGRVRKKEQELWGVDSLGSVHKIPCVIYFYAYTLST